MVSKSQTKIATKELAALAFAAYRKQNNQVFKDSSFYDKVQDAVITVTPNKILMRSGELAVTEQDRTDAVEAIEVLTQDRTMRILKNLSLPEFQNTMTNLVVQTECTQIDAGLMAFLPTMIQQIRSRQSRDEELTVLSQTSEYLGKVGDKITAVLTVISSRWSQQFNCWSVTAKDATGNLVGYFTSKEDCTKSGAFTAKIKRTETSNYHNGAKVTTLNFVKPI